MEITYKCEVCGKDFVSHRVRKGRVVCGPCAGDLRKKGQGVFQLAKGHPVEAPKAPKPKAVKVEEEATVETEKTVEAPATEGKSLSQLAKELREKYDKKKKPGIGEQAKGKEQ